MKARSTVHALLAVTEHLIAAKKAAMSKQVVAESATSGSADAKLAPETRPLLAHLTALLAS